MVTHTIKKHSRAFAVAGTALVLAVSGLLDSRLVPASYDRTLQLRGQSTLVTNSPVVLVYLDLESYLSTRQSPDEPWSRALHAQLVRRLTRAGVKAIVFDIIFDQAGKDANADAELAEAIHASGRVILAAELDFSSRATTDQLGTRDASFERPQARFADAAAAWGIAKLAIDDDLVVRRLFPGWLSQNQPSLTWAAATYLNLPGLDDQRLKSGQAWVRYYGAPLTIPYVSYRDALDSNAVEDEFFRDKIVFIGARPLASGFDARKDEFRSPFSAWGGKDLFMPAVEVHATQMLNLVRGDWLRRVPTSPEAWLLIATACGLSALLFRFRPLPAAVMAVATEVILLGAVEWLFRSERFWFPWLVISAVQIPGAFTGSILFHSLEWYQARRRLEALRLEAETKIREQAALIDKAQDAILVQDLQGRMVYANPSAERLYGWSAAGLRQDGALEQLFAPASGKLADAHRAVMDTGEWTGELEQATRSGQKLTVESRWTLIRDAAGLPKSILQINTDITEKKRLEAQFLRAQRMDTIGALAGGMAHDLNNALAPILMGIQLLERKASDEETQRMLAVMEANTRRGAGMVRQVLTFSRGHGDQHELLSVSQLVHEIESILRQTLPKSINVSAMVPHDLWPVFGNATELHQVLLNLCVNARDAMPQGGDLTIAADNVELGPEEAKMIAGASPGQYVMLLVADAGSGISSDMLPHIFEPFFTTKAPGKGTGLGLSTLARIVRNHAGFVSVKSELGTGSTFEVYLPRAAAPPEPIVSPSPTELPHGHGECILLIEDNRSVREMVSASLAEHGYQVIGAANGAEAIIALQKPGRQIRLILSDGTLPPMAGADLLETIRADWPQIPLILMSGELPEAERSGAGAGLFLPKPFRLQQLLNAVHDVLCQTTTQLGQQ